MRTCRQCTPDLPFFNSLFFVTLLQFRPHSPRVSNTVVYLRLVSEKYRRGYSAPDISPLFTGGYGYDWYAAPSLVYRRASFCSSPHRLLLFLFPPYRAIAEGCPSLSLAPSGVRLPARTVRRLEGI